MQHLLLPFFLDFKLQRKKQDKHIYCFLSWNCTQHCLIIPESLSSVKSLTIVPAFKNFYHFQFLLCNLKWQEVFSIICDLILWPYITTIEKKTIFNLLGLYLKLKHSFISTVNIHPTRKYDNWWQNCKLNFDTS